MDDVSKVIEEFSAPVGLTNEMGQMFAPDFRCMAEEIVRLREELVLSEKYGRTKEDVDLINSLGRQLAQSEARREKLRGALEIISGMYKNDHIDNMGAANTLAKQALAADDEMGKK